MTDPRKEMGHDPAVQFARNLAYQESQRWAEYLERRTRGALSAWRHVREQLRQGRAV